ncbi:hypothetical protein Q8791_23415 [Nocardiopsis sp. CT-R113]|uniref:Uncharacterized protein n=1 Tax=Nocardiopsis codii TaxID=3065942 RepID=A0ABU7KD62_9ACTN|nr:hypothetical protein [Nocardiopsis sp. CT-R113]MEE2040170.1 hypothetical protein [Nocardiopsis sp. CT-R113]
MTAPTDLGQELTVTATGTGLITIGTGYCLVGGYWYRVTVPITRPVVPNTSGSARRDLVVVRADPLADTATVTILPGTPGSGTPPAPTRQGAGVWDVVLAVITIAGQSGVVAPGDVDTRPREFTAPSGAAPCLSTHRPPTPHRGMVALETDTGTLIVWTGTRWASIADTQFPTDWAALELRSGYRTASHGHAPSWCFIRPGRVELRGTIERSNGAALPSGDYYARVPAAARPGAWRRYPIACESRSGVAVMRMDVVSVNSTGSLPGQLVGYSSHSPRWICLDGIEYDL